ncbi:MAG: EamA family transporter [Chloroflexi bacterium]|nr:EamA family transporter [Chloroflexota bacterium]
MLRPFLLLLIALCFTVTGELLLKHGMNKVGVLGLQPSVFLPMLWRTFTTPQVVLGFASIFAGSIFWLAVISRLDLSLAYPMLSIGYIIVVIASWLLLGEQITGLRVLGTLIIMGGVFVITRG